MSIIPRVIARHFDDISSTSIPNDESVAGQLSNTQIDTLHLLHKYSTPDCKNAANKYSLEHHMTVILIHVVNRDRSKILLQWIHMITPTLKRQGA